MSLTRERGKDKFTVNERKRTSHCIWKFNLIILIIYIFNSFIKIKNIEISYLIPSCLDFLKVMTRCLHTSSEIFIIYYRSFLTHELTLKEHVLVLTKGYKLFDTIYLKFLRNKADFKRDSPILSGVITSKQIILRYGVLAWSILKCENKSS